MGGGDFAYVIDRAATPKGTANVVARLDDPKTARALAELLSAALETPAEDLRRMAAEFIGSIKNETAYAGTPAASQKGVL
jgi:hypothetical protein